jgi:MFS family permease
VLSGGVLTVYAIARQHHISLLVVGVILAAGGVGNLLGTALSTPVQRRMHFGAALCLMLALFVLIWPFYSLTSLISSAGSPIFLGIVVASFALVDSINAILTASYRLTATPCELQGRVGGAFRIILFCFSLILTPSLSDDTIWGQRSRMLLALHTVYCLLCDRRTSHPWIQWSGRISVL